MIKLKLTFGGLLGRVRKGDLGNEVKARTKSCLEDACKDWVTGKQTASLSSRMKPGAVGAYGFKRRSPEYVKQQVRQLGAEIPYASPRWHNYARLTTELLKGDKANPLAIARAMKYLARNMRTPMRKLVVRPGGYLIRIAGSTNITARITLPGARILNKGGSRNEAYRNELLDFTKGGGRDRAFIFARCQQLMQSRVFGWMSGDGTGSKVSGLRGLKSGMRRLGRGA
jgi:hypothetical protein